MIVIAIRSFVDSKHGSITRGREMEYPDGVNWLEAGFVEPAGKEAPEAAMLEPAKSRTSRTKRAPKGK